MSRTDGVTVRQALQIAQNSTTEQLEPRIVQLLEEHLRQTWGRIEAHPKTYVMDALEFAVFNRYRARAQFQNETARKAVKRYWDSKGASDGGSSQ